MQDKIFGMLFDKDEITWQSMIYEAVRSEEMDPWDIDVSLLAQKFLDMLRKLKETDFLVSGKVVLAAALFLKMKSTRLIGQDIEEFDRLFASTEETEYDDFYEELEAELEAQQGAILGDEKKDFKLIPRTPQPRKRKVSVYDLVDALNKALEVKRRRVMRDIPELKIEVPEDHVSITVVIGDLYERIKSLFYGKGKHNLTFSQLIPSNSKEDKVMTFIPLLHLTNQRKIDLNQDDHFGEIDIFLRQKSKEAIKT